MIDIAVPIPPEIVATLDTPGDAYGIALEGNIVYVGDRLEGVQVIDVSDPDAPSIIGVYDTSSRVYGLDVAGNEAYLADGGAGLTVLDVADPTNPTLLGGYKRNPRPSRASVGISYSAAGSSGSKEST